LDPYDTTLLFGTPPTRVSMTTTLANTLTENRAQAIFDMMCLELNITGDDSRDQYKKAMWRYFMINGSSDRMELGKIEFDYGAHTALFSRLTKAVPMLHGKLRRFLRHYQFDAYRYLFDDDCAEFRLQMVQKFSIKNADHVACYVDWFWECLTNEEQEIASVVKDRRIQRSSRNRTISTSQRTDSSAHTPDFQSGAPGNIEY